MVIILLGLSINNNLCKYARGIRTEIYSERTVKIWVTTIRKNVFALAARINFTGPT